MFPHSVHQLPQFIFTAITMAYLHQHFCEKQHSTLFLYNALPPYPKHVFMT